MTDQIQEQVQDQIQDQQVNQSQTNQPQQFQPPQFYENYCLITSKIIEIPEFLQKIKKYGHVCLIDSEQPYYHPNVLMFKCQTIDEYARLIYKTIFDKRLLHILVDDEDKFCMAIKDKVTELVNLDRGFCFGQGGQSSIVNLWSNLPQIIKSPNTTGLQNLYQGKPVVLVNSGPSLSKNIDILKEYKDKVIIVACSTAIVALYKHGITPHYLMISSVFPTLRPKRASK